MCKESIVVGTAHTQKWSASSLFYPTNPKTDGSKIPYIKGLKSLKGECLGHAIVNKKKMG